MDDELPGAKRTHSLVLKMAKSQSWRRAKFITSDELLDKLAEDLLVSLKMDGKYYKGSESELEKLEIKVSFHLQTARFNEVYLLTHQLDACSFISSSRISMSGLPSTGALSRRGLVKNATIVPLKAGKIF